MTHSIAPSLAPHGECSNLGDICLNEVIPAPTPAERFLSTEQVFQEHACRIYNIARHLLDSEEGAEAVTKHVLQQVIRRLKLSSPIPSFSTWLHHVTVNAALAERRARASEAVPHNGSSTILTEQRTCGQTLSPLIDGAIATLSSSDREVYVLADVEGLSDATIAEQLGLSQSDVKSALHRARVQVRSALAPHFRNAQV